MATDKRKSLAGRMNDIIGGIVEAKADTERGLQSVGRNIRKNVAQGQKDYRSGAIKEYATINPLKGTIKAFKEGFYSQ